MSGPFPAPRDGHHVVIFVVDVSTTEDFLDHIKPLAVVPSVVCIASRAGKHHDEIQVPGNRLGRLDGEFE